MKTDFDWDGVDPRLFTPREQELLGLYGSFYRRVMNRDVEIDNAERERFVRICDTALRTTKFVQPQTDHEKVWRKYLIARHTGRERTVTSQKIEDLEPVTSMTGKPDSEEKKKTMKSKRPPDRKKSNRDRKSEAWKLLKSEPVKEDTSKYRSTGPPPAKEVMRESLSESRSEIPEYESGYPDDRWYSTRDRSSLNPYSKRRPGEKRP